ncbi:MAG: S1 RNA-binding domain-containing protein [Candidatus Aenigmatarchaeota archaeon]
MKRGAKPEKGELVVCKITKIYPNSATAEIIEYGITGMIHASEVAKRWVRSIKEFLKEGQYTVCRVIDVEDTTILLSVKRVERDERERKLNEFKREKKAERILELAQKNLNLSQKEAERMYNMLIESFGSLAKAIEMATKNPESFKERVKERYADEIINLARKAKEKKVYEAKMILKLISYEPDGIERIKKSLLKLSDVEVRYISAPNYMILAKGSDHKDIKKRLKAAAEAISKDFPSATFEIME